MYICHILIEMSYIHRSVVFFKFLWLSTFKLLSLKGDLVLATSTPLTIGIPALIKKWLIRHHIYLRLGTYGLKL